MPVTEESRHRLHQKLDQTIGPEDATTLMEHLPPTGWADLPTRSEMNHRFDVVDQRFEMVDQRFEMVDQRFDQIDRRFDQIDRRFDQIDQRFDQFERRFEAADQRQASLENRIDTHVDRMIRHTWQVIWVISVIAGLLLAAAKYL